MRVFAFCGPIGAPIDELIKQLPEGTVIDEAQHLNPDKSLNVESILSTIDSQNTDFVLVKGHVLYTSGELRKKFDVKVFVDADRDTCLSNYLRQGELGLKEVNLDLKMADFINVIKLKNDLEVYPTRQYADIVVPSAKISGPIVSILTMTINDQHANTHEQPTLKTQGFFQTLK